MEKRERVGRGGNGRKRGNMKEKRERVGEEGKGWERGNGKDLKGK